MNQELITIRTYAARFEAEMDKQLLKAFGIESMVSADDAGGMRPMPFAYSPGAELIVRAQEAERAKAVLENRPQEKPATFS